MHTLIGQSSKVEKWGVFELALRGPESGNPFYDVRFGARFAQGGTVIEARGFYDGEGVYRVRFMPPGEGAWEGVTFSNRPELDQFSCRLVAESPSEGNRGPVEVANTCHFSHRDGTPYYPFGSTSYGWAHQPDEFAERTLNALAEGGFNKFRTGIMPHYSEHSLSTASCFPFQGNDGSDWDLSRFNPEYFRMMERRIEGLLERNIEADLILFHPYSGPWNFGSLPDWADKAYLRYAVSRFAAYRNVWWSLANEYDLMPDKTVEDWHSLCRTVAEEDPYGHLLSIHNGVRLYEAWKPWITHACIQDGLAVEIPGRAVALRNAYMKPVIYDEVCYEGNFKDRWGDLSAEELVFRFWQGAISGTYVGHGEVVEHDGLGRDVVWTGIGGELQGRSAPRIAFLRKILEEGPGCGWEPLDPWWHTGMARKEDKTFLVYLGKDAPGSWEFRLPTKELVLPEGAEFRVELIDTWNMTVTPVAGVFTALRRDDYFYGDRGGGKVPLPSAPYMALRIRALEG